MYIWEREALFIFQSIIYVNFYGNVIFILGICLFTLFQYMYIPN